VSSALTCRDYSFLIQDLIRLRRRQSAHHAQYILSGEQRIRLSLVLHDGAAGSHRYVVSTPRIRGTTHWRSGNFLNQSVWPQKSLSHERSNGFVIVEFLPMHDDTLIRSRTWLLFTLISPQVCYLRCQLSAILTECRLDPTIQLEYQTTVPLRASGI
jgi:hypothetical protein